MINGFLSPYEGLEDAVRAGINQLIRTEPDDRRFTLQEGRELLEHLPRPQAAQVWKLYQAACDRADQQHQELVARSQSLAGVVAFLAACESPDEVGYFYETYDIANNSDLQKKVWKSLPEADRSRLLPLIKEYKAGLQLQ